MQNLEKSQSPPKEFLSKVRALRGSSLVRIAAGDVASKVLLVAINLYLIRHLVVADYSHFTMLLNAVFLGYQLVCGPLERLFIAEHAIFREHIGRLQLVLSIIAGLGCVLWLWSYISWVDVLLIIFGVHYLAQYQVLRITFQQSLEFKMFSVAEILKNLIWFILIACFIAIPMLPPSSAAILFLIVATVVSSRVLNLKGRLRFQKLEGDAKSIGISALLCRSRYVIGYSLIGAVVPYMPLIMAANSGIDTQTASYGAAMRYLSILGIAVVTINTFLLPKMANELRGGQERSLFMKRMLRSAPTLAAFFIFAVSAVWVLIPYVDGGKYPALRSLFLILSLTPVLSVISAPYINILLLDGRGRTVALCMTCGVATSLVGYVAAADSSNMFWPAWLSLLTYAVIAAATVLCVMIKPGREGRPI